MGIVVNRSINEPIRKALDFQNRWCQEDNGLILSWEIGRLTAIAKPELAQKALEGQLVELNWRRGSWYYLAMWQGLRGEDLNIDTSKQIVVYHQTVTKTGKHKKERIRFPESGVELEYRTKLKEEGRLRELYYD